MFRFSFAVYAQCRVRLGAKTGQGNIVPAEMAHPVGHIIHPVDRARDLLQLAIGALPDEIVECQVAVACCDVEDIGGQFGDGGRRPRVLACLNRLRCSRSKRRRMARNAC